MHLTGGTTGSTLGVPVPGVGQGASTIGGTVNDYERQGSASPTGDSGRKRKYPLEDRTSPSPNFSARLIKYDKALVHSILDDGYLCHLAYVAPKSGEDKGGWPLAVPHLYSRVGETVYLHGSPRSRLAEHLSKGNLRDHYPVCVTVTHVDALIVGRSAFEHVIAYRSAVVHGQAYLVTDPREKSAGLRTLIDQVISGRSEDTRKPSDVELGATALIGVRIETATAKVRTGGPDCTPGDEESDHWAGVVPIRQVYGPPISAPDLKKGVVAPDYIRYLTEIKNQRNIRFTPPREKLPSAEVVAERSSKHGTPE
jgi:nitroimidazol reductase NimA-like FMN-containing flavoprotein (pyridoxamine 5'-phosphate oxidase superfamily)